MKKHFLAALLLTGYSLSSHAQAVISATDLNPVINDAFVSNTCDTTGVSAMAGGANVTWDFSSILHMTSRDTVVSITTTGCPHLSMFPGTTIASKTLSITDTTLNYFIASGTAFTQNGYYHSSTQNVTFTDPLDQIHYPMHYLDSFNDSYAGSIGVTYLGTGFTGSQAGTSHVVVDGWGTLKLPGGVVDTGVLREHMKQNFIDSSYIVSTVVAGFELNTYLWYKAGYHSALLTISYLDQKSGFPLGAGGTYLHETTVAYAQKYPLSIGSISDIENSLRLFPNPVKNELNIQFSALSNDNIRISLVDIMGREVAEISNATANGTQLIKYNTTSLAKGIYMIRLQSANETLTRKVVIE